MRQIDAAEQQREFLVTEDNFRFFPRGFRPPEAALLQMFGADPESAAVPEQQLQPVAPRIGEQKACPLSGSHDSRSRTSPYSPSKLLRMSVAPAAR